MTIEELKQHCIKTIKTSEAIESIPNVKITDSRRLQEHKMVLQLIEAWEKAKEEINSMPNIIYRWNAVEIIDKHLAEVEK